MTKKSSPSKAKVVEVEVEEGEIMFENVPSKTECSVPVAEAEKIHSSMEGTQVVSQNISPATVTVQEALSPKKKKICRRWKRKVGPLFPQERVARVLRKQ